MSIDRASGLTAEIDAEGALLMGGTLPDCGIRPEDIDALIMPLVTIGTRYACRINGGLTFHATPLMVEGQFVMTPENDILPAIAQEHNRPRPTTHNEHQTVE